MNERHSYEGDTGDIEALIRSFPRPELSSGHRGQVLDAARGARPESLLRRLLPAAAFVLLLVLDLSFSRFQDRQLAGPVPASSPAVIAEARTPTHRDSVLGVEASEGFLPVVALQTDTRQRLSVYLDLRAELLTDTDGG